MKIKTKITSNIVGFACIALICISVLALIIGYRSSLNHAHYSMMKETQDNALVVEGILEEKILVAKTMGNAPVIAQSLIASNSEFSAFSENERKNKIAELNSKWMATGDVNDPFLQSYMGNSAADYLKKQQKSIPREYGEIFLTNRYGALVAATGKLTTLAHSHKYWWLAACESGSVIDDRGFDESVGDRVFGVVVPIVSEDRTMGVLKCNLFLENPAKSFFHKNEHINQPAYQRYKTMIMRANGDVVLGEYSESIDQGILNALSLKMKKGISKSEVVLSRGKKLIISYVPIKLPFAFDGNQAANENEITDHTGGNFGSDWYAVSYIGLDVILIPFWDAIKWLLVIGLVLIFIMSCKAYFVISKLTAPIENLVKVASRVGKGDYSSTIDVVSDDEIGVLASSFRQMSEDIKKTTVPRGYVDKIIGPMIDMFIVLDEKGKIKEVNRATIELLDYNEDELIGKNMATLLLEEGRTFEGMVFQKILTGGMISNYEVSFKAKDGSKISVLLGANVIRNLDFEITDIVCIANDITKRKQDEEELEQHREHLEDLVKERTQQLVMSEKLAATGRLAASFAHEINSPLQGMTSHLELMENVFPENSKKIKNYNFVVSNTQKIAHIVKQLLDVHRSPQAEKSRFNIKELIEKVVGLADHQMKVKNISLESNFDQQLKEISGDEQQLHQVLLNLLLNAVDSCDSGGSVIIDVRCDKKRIEIQVKDDGAGIKAVDIEHVFDPFFSTKKGTGVGLGLFVCKGLIANHEGELSVESKLREGSAFTISLPIR